MASELGGGGLKASIAINQDISYSVNSIMDKGANLHALVRIYLCNCHSYYIFIHAEKNVYIKEAKIEDFAL